jgi:hypothetical protein
VFHGPWSSVQTMASEEFIACRKGKKSIILFNHMEEHIMQHG